MRKVNKEQAAVGFFSAIFLLFLVICPPWQEAAKNEIAYRKDIGRGFLWNPPNTVAVYRYFSGCTTASASYFHAVLNRQLLLEQIIPVLAVAIAFLWLHRSRKEKRPPMLAKSTTRFVISFLLALLVPPTGGVPMGALLASLPTLFMLKGEFWLVYAVFVPILYVGLALAMYCVLSALNWFLARSVRVRGV